MFTTKYNRLGENIALKFSKAIRDRLPFGPLQQDHPRKVDLPSSVFDFKIKTY